VEALNANMAGMVGALLDELHLGAAVSLKLSFKGKWPIVSLSSVTA
jgi:hypothetical protein